MAETLFLLLICANVLSILALCAVIFAWKYVQPLYDETWGKAIVEVTQLLTFAVGVGGTYAAVTDKKDWLRPAIAGVAALVFVKWAQWLGKRPIDHGPRPAGEPDALPLRAGISHNLSSKKDRFHQFR